MTWEKNAWTFETKRLRVSPWRARGDEALASFIVSALTPEVTDALPGSWQTGVTDETAAAWIEARDREGQMFLVETRAEHTPLGFFMFFPGTATQGSGEVRLGYVLARSAWGNGYASELVRGFLRRWDEAGVRASLLAGVTRQNAASRRVLEKNGFVQKDEKNEILTYVRCV